MGTAQALVRPKYAGKGILLIDNPSTGCDRLARSFGDLGFEIIIVAELGRAFEAPIGWAPDVILVEPYGTGQGKTRPVQRLRARWASAAVVVLTSAPSIASAVRAVRDGAAAYLTKPTTADQILRAINFDSDEEEAEVEDDADNPSVLTLDRAIWEYMSEVVQTAGSISEASRRLGVERRSLRRMLAKYSPK